MPPEDDPAGPPAQPRVAPGGRADVGLATWALAHLSGRITGTTPPNVFLVLGRHRRLFRGWLVFAGRLMPGGRLARREAELVIVRVAHLRRSAYELDQHRRLARRAKVSAAELDAVEGEWPSFGGWSARERSILAAVDGLHQTGDLDDGTWAGLRRHLDEREAIELVMLVGHYEMLATALTTLRVPLTGLGAGVAEQAPRSSLPRGRHTLSREQVETDQRLRLAVAMAEAVEERGYVGTPVAAVLARAGVSRETYYRLHADKLAGFLDSMDLVEAVLVARLAEVLDRRGDPLDRADAAVGAYLEMLVEHRPFARLFLVEAHAAGAEALARRARLQGLVAEGLADILGAGTEQDRFGCHAFVAAVGGLVTLPIVTGDDAAVLALRRPLCEHLRRITAPT